jgi:membrane glycosyltransferase
MAAHYSRATTRRFRVVAILISIVSGAIAAFLLLQFSAADGLRLIDLVLSFLVFLTTMWLCWGAVLGMVGLVRALTVKPVPFSSAPIISKTAILMPVYNEDPATSFARVAAMDAELAETGLSSRFHFAILSDTTSDEVGEQEKIWFAKLIETRDAAGRIFYRRRLQNKGRKAGNVKDFIERSGGAYDFALILDADSLMDAGTIVEMVRRMEADPQLGLLQTLPKIINAKSFFGRAMQFSASFFSPIFARGQETLQGDEGPFWGHNAMVRISAFANSCGLPELPGKAPFGGTILSHDYVEAALLARAGWRVRLDCDLEGSFEEGPENIIEYAKRDRRWCQGNLQHAALLGAPRLKAWSRFVFLQGIMSYIAPVLWVAFLIANIQATATQPEIDYFPPETLFFPVIPSDYTNNALALAFGIVGLLVLPKVLIVVGAVREQRAKYFGGGVDAAWSTFVELLTSSFNAPILLAYQTRSVFQVLSGIDGGWPATSRDQEAITFREAYDASYWITLIGIGLFIAVYYFSPSLIWWLSPVGIPLVLAPLVIWKTGQSFQSSTFHVPTEAELPSVVARHKRILSSWEKAGAEGGDLDETLPADGADKGNVFA